MSTATIKGRDKIAAKRLLKRVLAASPAAPRKIVTATAEIAELARGTVWFKAVATSLRRTLKRGDGRITGSLLCAPAHAESCRRPYCYRPSVDETGRKERVPPAGRRGPKLLFTLDVGALLSIAAPGDECATGRDLNPVGIDEHRFAVSRYTPVVSPIIVGRAHDQLHGCRRHAAAVSLLLAPSVMFCYTPNGNAALATRAVR